MRSARKKTANSKPKIANNEALDSNNAKIEAMKSKYETHYEKYNAIVATLVYGNNPENLISIKLDELKKLSDEASTSLEESYQLSNNTHKDFILFKIKMMILAGRLYEATDSSEKACEKYLTAMKMLQRSIKEKEFVFKSDFRFQNEVYHIYKSVNFSVESQKSPPQEAQRILDLFGQVSFNFQNKCDNNIIRLRILYLQMTGFLTLPAETIIPPKIFSEVYSDIISSFTKEKIDNELNTIKKIYLTEAYYLKLNWEIAIHSNGEFSKDLSESKLIEKEMAKVTPQILINFLNSWTKGWRKNYINPSIQLLKDLNLDHIKDNVSHLNSFYESLKQWREIISSHLDFFKGIVDKEAASSDGINLITSAGKEIVVIANDIINLFSLIKNNPVFLDKKFDVGVDEVKLEVKKYEEKIETRQSNLLTIQEDCHKAADKNADQLIKEVAVENAKNAAKLKQLEDKEAEKDKVNEAPMPDKSSSSSEEESSPDDNKKMALPPPCKTLELLMKYDMDTIEFSNILLNDVESFHKILSNRSKQDKPLEKDKQNINQSLEKMVLKYNHLLKLYEKNKALSKKEEILKESDIQAGIEMGQNIILGKINVINAKIQDCLKLFNEINLKIDEGKKAKKISLAHDSFKREGIDPATLSEAEIMKRGESEFKRIGKEKPHKGESSYTQERRAFDKSKHTHDCLLFLLNKMNALNGRRTFASCEMYPSTNKSISNQEFQFFLAEMYFNQLSESNDPTYLKEALDLYETACKGVLIRGDQHLQAKIFYKKAVLKEKLLNHPELHKTSMEAVAEDYDTARKLLEIASPKDNKLIRVIDLKFAEWNEKGNICRRIF